MRLVQMNVEITNHLLEMKTTGPPALRGRCPIAQAGDK